MSSERVAKRHLKFLEQMETAQFFMEAPMDYERVRRQMRSLTRMAKEVIEQTECRFPDDRTITRIVEDEMSLLMDEIVESTFHISGGGSKKN
jgi:hypothetical protein